MIINFPDDLLSAIKSELSTNIFLNELLLLSLALFLSVDVFIFPSLIIFFLFFSLFLWLTKDFDSLKFNSIIFNLFNKSMPWKLLLYLFEFVNLLVLIFLLFKILLLSSQLYLLLMANWLFSFIVLLFNILNKSLLVLLLGFKGFNILEKDFY